MSGVDIEAYINKNVNKKKKVDFLNTLNEVGYSLKEYKYDTLVWSFNPRKTFIILNFRDNRLELGFKGSSINKEQKSKKVIIKSINDTYLDWFINDKILSPESQSELSLVVNNGKEDVTINIKPKQTLVKREKVLWIENKNYQTDLAKNFWNKS